MPIEYGIDNVRIGRTLKTRFPDVEIVMIPNMPAKLIADNDDLPDIILAAFSGAEGSALPRTCLEESFTQNYHTSALSSCATNGVLPYLPGPSNIYRIVYDKELFAQNGWEVLIRWTLLLNSARP